MCSPWAFTRMDHTVRDKHTTFTPAMGYLTDLGWFAGHVSADTECTPTDPDLYAPSHTREESYLHVDHTEAMRFTRALWEQQDPGPFTESLLPLWDDDGTLYTLHSRTPDGLTAHGQDDYSAPYPPATAFRLGGFSPTDASPLRWEALVRCAPHSTVGPVVDDQVEYIIMRRLRKACQWQQFDRVTGHENALRTAYQYGDHTSPEWHYRPLQVRSTILHAPLDLLSHVDQNAQHCVNPAPWDQDRLCDVVAEHGVAHQDPQGTTTFQAHASFEAARLAHADQPTSSVVAYRVQRRTWVGGQIGA